MRIGVLARPETRGPTVKKKKSRESRPIGFAEVTRAYHGVFDQIMREYKSTTKIKIAPITKMMVTATILRCLSGIVVGAGFSRFCRLMSMNSTNTSM
mgnify:CR=1 FL=1